MKSLYSLTDKALVAGLKIGDEVAFNAIYRRYWKKLLAIAYNQSKDKSVAEEIVQEVFIRLWFRRTFLEIESLEAYLATAVKFSVFKFFYKQKRREDVEGSFDTEGELSSISEDQIDARFTWEYINCLVEELPPKCRLVFKYSRVKGLSIPEISEEMGIAEKTVEAHLTKGLKTLRLKLRDFGLFCFVNGTFIVNSFL